MRYILAAAAIFAATACADSTAPSPLRAGTASNDMDVNETEPTALVAHNPCNGDVVALTGTLHIVLHTTTATSGNEHFYIDFTSSYSGIGAPSLVGYNGSERTLNDFSTGDPFPIVFSFYQDIQLQSQTGVDNYTLTVHQKITINNNGTVTAETDNVRETCNG